MMKTKKLSSPPMIILMDSLVMFLFVFMIQKTPSVDLDLPKEALFTGAKVVYTDALSGEKLYEHDGNWIPLDSRFSTGAYILSPCKYDYCSDYKTPHNEKTYVAITGKLLAKLSMVHYLACNNDASRCNDISYPITISGKIDAERLLDKYSVFREIQGISHYL